MFTFHVPNLPKKKQQYTRCLNIHRTCVTANNTTYNNLVFFIVSDLKIVYYNNY